MTQEKALLIATLANLTGEPIDSIQGDTADVVRRINEHLQEDTTP